MVVGYDRSGALIYSVLRDVFQDPQDPHRYPKPSPIYKTQWCLHINKAIFLHFKSSLTHPQCLVEPKCDVIKYMYCLESSKLFFSDTSRPRPVESADAEALELDVSDTKG